MNFDLLLAAVSGPSPCGEDLSFSSEFDAIQEMRRADDPTLDQGEWVTALKSADWSGVLAECEQLLSQRTKDLRVAAWLTDARARLAGYAGLADGLTLYRLLCEEFWDHLHPRLEDGDAEQRGGSLRWLLAQVESLAHRLPVLREGAAVCSLSDMALAQTLSRKLEPAGGAPAGEGRITLEDIAALSRKTPPGFLAENLCDVQRAQQALEQLQGLALVRLGEHGPGFAGARSALADAALAVERLAREADTSGVPIAAAQPVVSAYGAPQSDAEVSAMGPLRTRAQALQQLRMVADFFRRTEPHSPVAYLAERAAQWGDMPLHAWLRTVLKDQGALSQVEELLGVPPQPTMPE